MVNRTEIRDQAGMLLAYKASNQWPKGLCPYSEDDDYVQVLSWNYEEGKKLNAHQHLTAPRATTRTQEVVVVLSGRLRADVYDPHRHPVANVLVGPGEFMVFLAGGHGFEIVEPGTRILEIKNGPYLGPEVDRERFEP